MSHRPEHRFRVRDRRGARRSPQRGLFGVVAALIAGGISLSSPACAAEHTVALTQVLDRKATFGRVESYEIAPARARIGGTVLELAVVAGSAVRAGDVLAVIGDPKLSLQMQAVEGRLKALEAQHENARVEYERGQALFARGITPQARVDQLRTAVDVLINQIEAAKAERAVVVQQSSEGQVLAPRDGRVLAVPVARGAVVLPGEPIAQIAAGGYFLRLALPERHAAQIRQGDAVTVGARGMDPGAAHQHAARDGRVVKVYPQLDSGRVIADVEVEGLGDFFVGERVQVWIPVGKRDAIVVPRRAVFTRNGVDYVRLAAEGGALDVAVILGAPQNAGSEPGVEIMSGLSVGDRVVLP